VAGDLLTCQVCSKPGIRLPEGARLSATVTCEACGAEKRTDVYISTPEQLRRAGAAALANRANMEAARRDGVRCKNCNATIALPADISTPQFPCSHCGAMQLTQSFVAPELMMGLGLRDNMRALVAEHHAKAKRNGIIIAVLIVVIASAILVGVIFARP
jgi:predicted RNA-binding Zn-ribbon protein involved in translation (DUF1610 family)